MPSRTITTFLVASALALAGCEPWVVGDGVFKEEERSHEAFVGISVQDGLEVEATDGASAQSVKVSGDQNVLVHVLTEVEDEGEAGKVLVVKTDVAHIQSTHPLRVTVAAQALVYAQATEEAALEVRAASAEELEVRASNGAGVTLSGQGGDHLTVALSGGPKGGASLDARSYIVDEAQVTMVGYSIAELHVDEAIQGSVEDGSTLANLGEGTCEGVTTGSGGTVQCPP